MSAVFVFVYWRRLVVHLRAVVQNSCSIYISESVESVDNDLPYLPRLVGVLSSKQTRVSSWREVRLEEFKVGWGFAGSSSIDMTSRTPADLSDRDKWGQVVKLAVCELGITARVGNNPASAVAAFCTIV